MRVTDVEDISRWLLIGRLIGGNARAGIDQASCRPCVIGALVPAPYRLYPAWGLLVNVGAQARPDRSAASAMQWRLQTWRRPLAEGCDRDRRAIVRGG